MLGKEVAERIRRIRPDIQVLFMSGYAQPVLASEGKLDRDVNLIEKPFTAAAIVEKAGKILNGNFEGFRTLLPSEDNSRSKSEIHPEPNSGSHPGTNSESRPEINPGTNPGTNSGSHAEKNSGSHSGTNSGSHAGTNAGTTPETKPGTTPEPFESGNT
jgi:hypothetical protein